ncbi:MAG: response regulator [Candidatus Omnitrophica bacterium]|nr:response regulator [Candidatus Omnitrophota bacterium]MCA9415225.1 response regulator [Candidatus Omnitrophota bacterium]MCA9423762.1 response regulator [Candidatus Omnitrophota bacterium]MCB9767840.1 response regulator [Candidatus Omnitrophota bacterium]MCB9781920.1 response regulator [Candidatus Omnitrophota bacterium]
MLLAKQVDPATIYETRPVFPRGPEVPKILIVDDEEDIRKLLATALTTINGYVVDTAEDGRDALQKMRQRRFDAVITDLRMPEMDGTRLLDISRNEFPDIPIIVITGFARLETAIEALQLGASNFITKPFRIPEIKDVIEKAIQRKRDHEIPRRTLPCLVEENLVFHIPPTMEAKSGVIHYLTEKLVGAGICDESGKYFVSVSLDEALTNSLFYGCLEVSSNLRETEEGNEEFNRLVHERMEMPEYRQRAITVEMCLNPDEVVYRITDPGPGFDAPDLSVTLPEPSDLSSLHGRGLLLMTCFMDEVYYNDSGNQITLVKKKQRQEEHPDASE